MYLHEAQPPIGQTHFTAMKTRVQLSQPDGALRQSQILRAQETGS
jgi:hypothetical protein